MKNILFFGGASKALKSAVIKRLHIYANTKKRKYDKPKTETPNRTAVIAEEKTESILPIMSCVRCKETLKKADKTNMIVLDKRFICEISTRLIKAKINGAKINDRKEKTSKSKKLYTTEKAARIDREKCITVFLHENNLLSVISSLLFVVGILLFRLKILDRNGLNEFANASVMF